MSPHQSIKCWAEDDRPREKMINKGERALSNAELVAILIGSGYKNASAVEVAKEILAEVNNDVSRLSGLSLSELIRFRGMGPVKAITVKAALELGRRRQLSQAEKVRTISSSADAYKIISPYLQDKKTEEFWVLLFNRRNQLVKMKMISAGGVSATVVDAKIVFQAALEKLASGIILVHNHPSGNRNPGQSDITLTRKMKQAAELLDIDLLDHLVVTDHDYFSFRDEGLL